MLRFIFFVGFLMTVFWMGGQLFGPIEHPPGVVAARDPLQVDYPEPKSAIVRGSWKITPLASYSVTARVLETETYDSYPIDALVPMDLLLGWGPMSDSTHLAPLQVRIYNRYASWNWNGKAALSGQEMAVHMANTHIIPANDTVKASLDSIRVGSIVTLRGELVELNGPDGRMKSSVTRQDTGPGACEVVYVTSMSVR